MQCVSQLAIIYLANYTLYYYLDNMEEVDDKRVYNMAIETLKVVNQNRLEELNSIVHDSANKKKSAVQYLESLVKNKLSKTLEIQVLPKVVFVKLEKEPVAEIKIKSSLSSDLTKIKKEVENFTALYISRRYINDKQVASHCSHLIINQAKNKKNKSEIEGSGSTPDDQRSITPQRTPLTHESSTLKEIPRIKTMERSNILSEDRGSDYVQTPRSGVEHDYPFPKANTTPISPRPRDLEFSKDRFLTERVTIENVGSGLTNESWEASEKQTIIQLFKKSFYPDTFKFYKKMCTQFDNKFIKCAEEGVERFQSDYNDQELIEEIEKMMKKANSDSNSKPERVAASILSHTESKIEVRIVIFTSQSFISDDHVLAVGKGMDDKSAVKLALFNSLESHLPLLALKIAANSLKKVIDMKRESSQTYQGVENQTRVPHEISFDPTSTDNHLRFRNSRTEAREVPSDGISNQDPKDRAEIEDNWIIKIPCNKLRNKYQEYIEYIKVSVWAKNNYFNSIKDTKDIDRSLTENLFNLISKEEAIEDEISICLRRYFNKKNVDFIIECYSDNKFAKVVEIDKQNHRRLKLLKLKMKEGGCSGEFIQSIGRVVLLGFLLEKSEKKSILLDAWEPPFAIIQQN